MATQTLPAGAPPQTGATTDKPAAPEKSMSPQRRRILIVVGVIVALFALVFGIRYLAYALTHESTDDAKIDTDQVTITSKISERVAAILVNTNDPVKKGQLLIRLDSLDEQTRLAQAQANVTAADEQARAAQTNVVYVRQQQVAQNLQNQGQIHQASSTITSAAAQAESEQKQIAVAQAGIETAQAELRTAQAAVPGALASLRNAQAAMRRAQALVASGDVAQAQLDSATAEQAVALANYQAALANVSSAQASVAAAQQKLDAQRAVNASSQAQIEVAQGTLTTARGKFDESSAPARVVTQQANADALRAQAAQAAAQAQTAKDQLSYTQIHSPIDGYVGEKYVEIGQTVAPGTSLMAIIPTNDSYVTANFKETQLGSIHPGQDVDVSIDAYKGVTFRGRVKSIGPASENTFSLVPAQNATGNFVKVTQRVPVRIVFVDPDPKYPLRPGMSVIASVKVR